MPIHKEGGKEMTRKETLEHAREIVSRIFHGHKEEVTLKAWATRDEGSVWVMISSWRHKPKKLEHVWDRNLSYCAIRSIDFPSVKWEDDEPTEAELTIKLHRK